MAPSPRRRTRGLAVALLASALLPLPAAAASISAVQIVTNPGNTANFFDNTAPASSAVASSASVLSSSAAGFSTRYAAVVAADIGGAGSPATLTQGLTANFTISFQVTAAVGEAWSVDLAIGRAGAMTIVSDGNGDATVTLGALAGSVGGAGSLSSGSLGLAALPNATNTAAEATSPDAPVSQSTTGTVSGVGTGAAQLVTITFSFAASATSHDRTGGGTRQGDEAALRLGMDSALSLFSADDYPGAGGRTLANDGVFVTGVLATPEPETALLLSLGMAGLAILGRERRPRRDA